MTAGVRILVVDDDAGTCETVSDVLRLKGHTVVTATGGRTALQALAAETVQLAIVDIQLPDMSGLDLLTAIKRTSPSTEVVFITGRASLPTAIQAINGAAFSYLVKPFEMDHLIAILNKAAEKEALVRALRDAEERYRLVSENILDAVFLLDTEGRIVFGNRRGAELTGFRADELLGRPIAALLAPDGAAESKRRIDRAVAGAEVPPFFETELVRKDGSRIWLEASITSVVNEGRVVGRLGVARDITRRKQAQAALRDSEERFRGTFEQAAVGIAHVDGAGHWVRVNQRLCDIVGFTPDELQRVRFQDITHPDDLERDLTLQRRMLAGEIPSFTIEKRYIHKTGSIVWVNLTVTLLRDTSGTPTYSIAVVQDITEQKRLQQELLHAQKLEGVGQLAGGIAHDFNNLLTVIAGRSHLILSRLQPADPLHRDFDVIQKTTDRAAALTRQLLAFSRKQVLQPKVVDLNVRVEQSATLVKRLIGEHIEVTYVPAVGLGAVRVDPGQIEQVIVNLCVNARDAMEGGGRLTIETANVELDAAEAKRRVGVAPGRYVTLTVTDTGIGMDAATQARMFEPFFTTKPLGKGTGLGLATVYGIVQQSGGHLRVFSELGAGTKFEIFLPRVDAAPDDISGAPDVPMPTGTETLLVVEDDDEVRHLVCDVLRGVGYTVLEAPSAIDALVIAERHPGVIALLLTDTIMPQMNGPALAERIVALRHATRVLLMSGYTDDAIVRHGVLEAGTSFLNKPFTPTALALKVREVLDAR